MTSSSKWSCPTCTYNNWPSWSKCVLCGCSKPIDEVIPRTPVARYRQQNSGWSKLSSSHPGGVGPSLTPGNRCLEVNTSPGMDSSHANVSQKGSAKCKTKGKWTCSSCTSLNWPNTGYCVTCGLPRTRSPRNDAATLRKEAESILLYASGGGAVGGASEGGGGSCDVPLHSSSASLKSKNGRQGKGGGQGSAQGKGGGQGTAASGDNKKWKCQRCTYENWPRALKCTMCLGPKSRTPSPPLSGTEESVSHPPASPHPLQHHSRLSSLSSQARSPSPHSSHQHHQLPSHTSHTSHTTTPLTPLNSNSSLSPSPSRGHPKPNDLGEARSNANAMEAGLGFNANIQPSKDSLPDLGSISSRERRISDRYNAIPRQIQLKSDSDEVSVCVCVCVCVCS